jgi:hypothetical protein
MSPENDMNKDQLRKIRRFHLVNPSELVTFEEWVEYLESLINEQCSVMMIDGKLTLLEIKALVDRIRGMRIEVYSREHPPPHFHVRSSEIDASFDIEDCKLIQGNISASDYEKIRYWHERAKAQLIRVWNESRPTICTVGPYKGQ